MATISVTKSGTLNPGAGRIDNDDTTTTAYAAGDALSVSAGAQLKINTSTAARLPGTIQANSATAGTIFVENTSTTVPIVVSLNLQTADILVTGRSLFKVRGDWIVVKTGDGTASQTIDFSNIGGVSIDYPPCVWVETGDSKHKQITVGGTPGYFMPFFNCAQTTDTLAINILTDFHGDLDHGPVFQFDRTTKIATFGKGGIVAASLGGAVIPNGARVIYPNIHFTSSTFDATITNRNELRCGGMGNVDISTCAWSPNWVFGRGANNGFFGGGDISITHMGISYSANFQVTIGTLNLNNLAIAPSYAETLTVQVFVSSAQCGVSAYDHIYVLGKYTLAGNTTFRVASGSGVENIGSIFSWCINTAATSDRNTFYFDGLSPPAGQEFLNIGPLYGVGGRLHIASGSQGIYVPEFNHSARCTAVMDTTNSDTAITFASVRNSVIGKVRKMAAGAANRGVLANIDGDSYQCAVKDVVYNGAGNLQTTASTAGSRIYLSNFTCDNIRTAVTQTSQTNKSKSRIAGIRSNSVSLANGGGVAAGAFVEWSSGSTGSWTSLGGQDSSPFNCCWTNAGRTAGNIHIGPFAVDALEDHQTIVSGAEGADWYNNKLSALFVEGNGVELIYFGTFPIRGITDFTGASWTATGTNYNTNATYEFSMRLPDDTAAWGSWYDATTAANWQVALAALSGYTSNAGFFLRFRVKTSAALAGRAFQYARISCTTDSAWVPAEIGFVPIKPTGLVANSTVRLMVNTVPASPVTVKVKSISGSSEVLDFPYDFDAQPKAYRIVARKAGYAEASVSGNTYQSGRDVAISQQQIVAVDESAAAALTGISINGATATVTVSSNHSLAELYAYCQWWAMQVANMAYEIPLVTTNGTAYSSGYDFVVDAGVAITGSGSVDLGSKTLTMGAGASSTFDWRYASGTKTWTRIALSGIVAGSRVQVYDLTAAAELSNGVVAGTALEIQKEWTADHTIRVRATYCSGTTAKLPYVASGVFGSGGMSLLLAQAADTVYAANAIDGSTVTGLAADYSNVQVDITDADNRLAVQEFYAWYVNLLTTADGIRYYFKGAQADDTVNYAFDTSVISLKVQNMNIDPLVLYGGRLYCLDGSSFIAVGTGSIEPQPGKAYIANSTALAAAVAAIPTNPLLSSDTRLNHLDADVSSRLASSGYTAPPSAAAVRAEMDASSTKLSAIDAKTTNLPSDPADQSLVIAATDAILERIGIDGAHLTAIGDARLASPADIATALRAEIAVELGRLTKLAALSAIDATLVVTPTTRSAGSVTQTITTVGDTTTVT